ncbi:MAG: hypothetical protein OXF64_07935 [bacterium]|nr:hypothetical protein [bacterium]MCY4194196.1 hypothetical protein [bacterium]MCY4272562.1 hypothetical protein [bacterium]
MKTELRFCPHSSADLLSRQPDGLAASVGQHQALRVDADLLGEEHSRVGRIGIPPQRVEMASEHRLQVGGERVGALRQIQNGEGINAQGPGNARSITAMGAGGGDVSQLQGTH